MTHRPKAACALCFPGSLVFSLPHAPGKCIESIFLKDSAHSLYWGDFSTAQVSSAFLCVPCLAAVPGCLSPGKTNLARVAKPFSWNDLTTKQNCSGAMFRAFPEKKGHCHSQGLVQCTPQKEGKKVNIENWGDIQSYKRQDKRKASRKWPYNGAKSRLLGPEHLFRQPPRLVTDLISK